jgi:hypothetical protein
MKPLEQAGMRGVAMRRAAWIRSSGEVKPTTAKTLAQVIRQIRRVSPRSILPTAACDMTLARPTSAWLSPAATRAVRTWVAGSTHAARSTLAPRSAGRSVAPMGKQSGGEHFTGRWANVYPLLNAVRSLRPTGLVVVRTRTGC